MFALESLALVGESYSSSPRVKRACEYLIDKQRKDGGWGESYKVTDLLVTLAHSLTHYPSLASRRSGLTMQKHRWSRLAGQSLH